MVLNFFFVFPQLLLHLMQCRVEDRSDGLTHCPRFMRHKIMAMFGIHKDFDVRSIVGKINDHFDRGNPVEKR